MLNIFWVISIIAISSFFILRDKEGRLKKYSYISLVVGIVFTIIAFINLYSTDNEVTLNINENKIKITFPSAVEKSTVENYGDVYSSETNYGIYKVIVSNLGPENNLEILVGSVNENFSKVYWSSIDDKRISVDYEQEINGVLAHVYVIAYEFGENLVMLLVEYRAGNKNVEDVFSTFMNPVIKQN